MDAGTIAAIVALVVALFALLVAFAQVIQQYVATADLMRKCDSIVYGPLPGKGRRVWVVRQLHFKVVYSIPQISLRPDLSQVMNCIACLEDLGSMEWAANIYMMAQHLVAKP